MTADEPMLWTIAYGPSRHTPFDMGLILKRLRTVNYGCSPRSCDPTTLNLPDGVTWKSKTSKSAIIFKFYCPTNNGYSTVRSYEVLFFEFLIEVFRQLRRRSNAKMINGHEIP